MRRLLSRLKRLLSTLSHFNSAFGSRRSPVLVSMFQPFLLGYRYLPLMKWGTKQWAVRFISPHSRPTLMAVRMLSPVTIMEPMFDSVSSDKTPAVAGFSLFSKMMKPTKSSSLSTSARDIFCALTQLSLSKCLVAQPITLYPLWV